MSDVALHAAFTIRDSTSVLPAELLALIFWHLVMLHPHERQGYIRHPARPLEALDWISISHVCRRWRTIALDSPGLWCRLYYPRMGPAYDIFKRRSKNLPLFVKGSLDNGNALDADESFVASLLDQRHRIQELHLYDMYMDALSRLLSGFTGPLPHVTSLSLSCFARADGEDLLKLPDNIFIESPRLEYLRLVGVEFPSNTGSPSLRTLDYTAKTQDLYFFEPPRSHADIAGIVNTLRQMPALHTLYLNLMEPPANSTIASSLESCSLPHLTDLVLSSDRIASSLIWAQLRLPSFTRISIRNTKCIGRGAESESRIVSLWEKHLASCFFPSALHITTGATHRGRNERLSLGICKWREPGSNVSQLLTGDRPLLDLRLGLPSRIAFLKNLLPRLPVNSTRKLKLTINGDGGWDQATVRDLFLPMRSVTYLQLAQDDANIVLEALIPARSDQPTPNDDTLFPALTHLRCVDMSFKNDAHVGMQSQCGSDALSRVLETRSTGRARSIRRVVLEMCRDWEEHVETWKGFGVDVVPK
ncbi:hypothetical protein PENSPDRAFT_734790 [Peniophora sp. CONT]|nr:hypothetical protein PENSPDRAFT_734790 [Peniophora sp. CONT]